MKYLWIIGLLLFIIGAAIGIMDLLDVIVLDSRNNPFYGALSLMIAGICFTFLSQAREKVF